MYNFSTLSIPAALALGLLSGCASVTVSHYEDGTVTASPVTFRASAPPLLQAKDVRTYRVTVTGAPEDRPAEVSAFRYRGLARTEGTEADLLVTLELGTLEHGEPAAVEADERWYPAFAVLLPYTIAIEKPDGTKLGSVAACFASNLTFRNLASFGSREKALSELDHVGKDAGARIEERGRAGAFAAAKDALEKLAAELFAERRAYVDVPVVRSAAGVDLESAYRLLAGASDADRIRKALAAYEERGMFQLKADGTQNRTGNYGVACGIAAARLMLRDFTGAWQWCKLASSVMPGGKEVAGIERAILMQEQVTGVLVIPEGEREGLASGGAGPGQGARASLGTPGR
jgi:hypothetical protein